MSSPESPANAPPEGVLTLLVTTPASRVTVLAPLTEGAAGTAAGAAAAALSGSACSARGLALPVMVAARDRLRIKLGKNDDRGEVGLASGAGAAEADASDVLGYCTVGSAICVGRWDEPGRAILLGSAAAASDSVMGSRRA